jgi:endonuclease III
MDTKTRARKINTLLKEAHPDAHCELTHRNALELLVATILSAQCTDKRVNLVTPVLFKKYRSAADYAKAPLPILERQIRSTGFYRQKAKTINRLGELLQKRFEGKVPQTLEELVTLPGVWRKTANVILGNLFGVPGIVVDTHMIRLSRRMGLTRQKDPDKIEQDLMKLIPKKDWTVFSHGMIFHGRRVCGARKPLCSDCILLKHCPRRGIPA